MYSGFLVLLHDETTVIEKLKEDQLKEIPVAIKYIIKFEGLPTKTATASGSIFSYSSVDLNGSPKPIEVGNFLFLDLGTENNVLNNHKQITVMDRHTGIVRKFDSHHGGEAFIINDLLPLIRELSNVKNWEPSDVLEELSALKEENKRLQATIEELLAKGKDFKQI